MIVRHSPRWNPCCASEIPRDRSDDLRPQGGRLDDRPRRGRPSCDPRSRRASRRPARRCGRDPRFARRGRARGRHGVRRRARARRAGAALAHGPCSDRRARLGARDRGRVDHQDGQSTLPQKRNPWPRSRPSRRRIAHPVLRRRSSDRWRRSTSVPRAIALVSDTVWAVVASQSRARFARSPRRLETLSAAGGVVMIGLAARLAVTNRAD
jgi:hypothetical protein